MIDEERLKILTESAKYDVSCSSSGSSRKNTAGGIGNASFGGICHSFTEDGRCISLLKILMSNRCGYDCLYCVNRRSNDVPRAEATPDELCELVMSFYKRNYIEGLFLSSAVCYSPDKTMELLLETVMKLRKVYGFNGYIHLKGIPHADEFLIRRAGDFVDRMSFNIELPSEKSLKLLAPQKSKKSILEPMSMLAKAKAFYPANPKNRYVKKYLPAGQTTQMIIGASPETDGQILKLTQGLYNIYKLKRVYYSSYVPTNFKTPYLPVEKTPLLREHRLYQADWLIRFYGFTADEIVEPNGNLLKDFDPKCAWALRNLGLFPVEVNAAPFEVLVRVPGIGLRSAYKIVEARKYGKLDFNDLYNMRVVLKRATHFITCNGKYQGVKDERQIKTRLLLSAETMPPEQLDMFSSPEIKTSVLTGEL